MENLTGTAKELKNCAQDFAKILSDKRFLSHGGNKPPLHCSQTAEKTAFPEQKTPPAIPLGSNTHRFWCRMPCHCTQITDYKPIPVQSPPPVHQNDRGKTLSGAKRPSRAPAGPRNRHPDSVKGTFARQNQRRSPAALMARIKDTKI